MRKISGVLFLLAIGLLSAPAQAEFSMSEMVIDFTEQSPRQKDIEIVSRDKQTQYVATETYVIEHPRDPNEKRTLLTDPAKSGLLITPGKMVLPAGARKLIRFLPIIPPAETDRIYRVVVKPVIQGIEAKKAQVALKILVGYEALVIIRPKNAKIELVGERKGNTLTITNKGNTNASLQSGQQCDQTGGNCKDINVTRIYAGQTWTTTLPNVAGVVKFLVWDGITGKEMTF